MYIEREDDGVWLRAMPMWVVDTLLCLPDWIESDNPDVKARLLPKAYQDDEQDREWRDALGSSLEHLVAKRTEILRSDLRKLELVEPRFDPAEDDPADDDPADDDPADDDPADDDAAGDRAHLSHRTLFNVWIPGEHVSAWISTLQAGTHAIFILDGLTAEDVAHEGDSDLDPDKHISIVRLAILQEILVRLLED